MSIGIGIVELIILAGIGLLCVGVPIGIIVALMAGNRKRDE